MFFTVAKLVWALLTPTNLLLVTLITGLCAARLNRQFGVRLASASAFALFVCALLPVGDWLLSPLETRFPPATDGGAATRIIETPIRRYVARLGRNIAQPARVSPASMETQVPKEPCIVNTASRPVGSAAPRQRRSR
jgi:uncharacterized SAM-binding protein YcdF (DUF218 family)